ncbi:hypothetical protein BDV3_002654 [Batrachochytrium dendrobatidis]|uniref:5'-3' exoribonuclease 1 n=1 Tax=Batrachochytrium dendrobatidis (strain JEL423) TaxID=403673 RepID=A0A177WX52_BATDL|nr:hypothetical protein BDEG_27358 [Batrachochytrium dendrobatidis JEL423]
MGVPKFFRWISERYPLCSEIIQEKRIPEFDNLYLDMNGIIHNCSHPNDDDASFRITETQIFLAIFTYINHIFTTIRPKKLFFLAVDGVAPRAKMNQQRSRRFRSAYDAKLKMDEAIRNNHELPSEPPFDSNCITPGTPFMSRLQEQLKYFLSKKISEDGAWRHVQVVFSGHDVPGEGEHKIMEYIRTSKSCPDYQPNLRHCLYGLDADLMMLGLLSHEPHFSLLREEVTFGRKKHSSTPSHPESITFFLLHLSLFREYLDLEFNSLKNVLPFEYDFERIIDDFILLGFFIGNDFLPSLPDMHINDGALPLLFDAYKQILVKSDGYINNHGIIDLKRCQTLFDELRKMDFEKFKAANSDSMPVTSSKKNSRSHRAATTLSITKEQHDFVVQIRDFVLDQKSADGLALDVTSYSQTTRAFVFDFARELGLQFSLDAEDAEDGSVLHFITLNWSDDEDIDDQESFNARMRVFKKYITSNVHTDSESNKTAEDLEAQVLLAYSDHKSLYYTERFGPSFTQPEKRKEVVAHYVTGLQWVLSYYYQGVQSWGWFFPYHFAPMIDDLVDISEIKLQFDIGVPFFPFEQLMGVLPALSRQQIPPVFQDLLVDANSPIIDFYPSEFELDMTGKKSDWEAIVKIPFIDEKRLLAAIRPRYKQLTKDEKARNSFGCPFSFCYNDLQVPQVYKSPLSSIHSDIQFCKTEMKEFILPSVSKTGFLHALCPGAFTGENLLPGFPSLNTIPYTGTLAFHDVSIFNSKTKNKSMTITLKNPIEDQSREMVARALIGQNVFTNWPFLQEALVVSISDTDFVYSINEVAGRVDVVKNPNTQASIDRFMKASKTIEDMYSTKCGTIIGPIETIVHVRPLQGMKLLHDGSFVKQFSEKLHDQALQTIVVDRKYEDPRYKNKPAPAIDVEFPLGSTVFLLTPSHYGVTCKVNGHHLQNETVDVLAEICHTASHTLLKNIIAKEEESEQYVPGWKIGKQLGITSLSISKICTSLFILLNESNQRFNVGLNLKFESRSKKVLGYSRKSQQGWEYSKIVIDLITEYKSLFPELFTYLDRKMNSNDYFKDIDVFPSKIAAARMSALKQWLHEKNIKGLVHVSLTANSLKKNTIDKIQKELSHQLNGPVETNILPIQAIPRFHILSPSHSKFRLLHQKFELGDRVKFTIEEGGIPVGAKGTVVGFEGDFIDILLDLPNMIATDLDGRCKKEHGIIVHKWACLNLTTHQPPPKPDSTERPKNTPFRPVSTSNAPLPSSWNRAPTILARPAKGQSTVSNFSSDARLHSTVPQQSVKPALNKSQHHYKPQTTHSDQRVYHQQQHVPQHLPNENTFPSPLAESVIPAPGDAVENGHDQYQEMSNSLMNILHITPQQEQTPMIPSYNPNYHPGYWQQMPPPQCIPVAYDQYGNMIPQQYMYSQPTPQLMHGPYQHPPPMQAWHSAQSEDVSNEEATAQLKQILRNSTCQNSNEPGSDFTNSTSMELDNNNTANDLNLNQPNISRSSVPSDHGRGRYQGREHGRGSRGRGYRRENDNSTHHSFVVQDKHSSLSNVSAVSNSTEPITSADYQNKKSYGRQEYDPNGNDQATFGRGRGRGGYRGKKSYERQEHDPNDSDQAMLGRGRGGYQRQGHGRRGGTRQSRERGSSYPKQGDDQET